MFNRERTTMAWDSHGVVKSADRKTSKKMKRGEIPDIRRLSGEQAELYFELQEMFACEDPTIVSLRYFTGFSDGLEHSK